MRIFEVTLEIEAPDSTTVEDVCKSLEENSSLIEFPLSEGNITDINVSDKEIQEVTEQFTSDKRINELLEIKVKVLSKAIPKYIVNLHTKEIKTVYDEVTQFCLDKIDEEIITLQTSYKAKI